jgi:hypothetical protein
MLFTGYTALHGGIYVACVLLREIQGDYERYVQLHKLIGKKVLVTQQLNTHKCKEKWKRFFFLLHLYVMA